MTAELSKRTNTSPWRMDFELDAQFISIMVASFLGWRTAENRTRNVVLHPGVVAGMRSFIVVLAVAFLAGCVNSTPDAEQSTGDGSAPDPPTEPVELDSGGADENATVETNDNETKQTNQNGTGEDPDGEIPNHELRGIFHSRDDDGALTVAPQSSGGQLTGSANPAVEDTWFAFDVNLTGDINQTAIVKLHWSVQQGVYADVEPDARFIIDGTTYNADIDPRTEILQAQLPPGSFEDMVLEVCICASSGAAASGYSIDLDDRSWVQFA